MIEKFKFNKNIKLIWIFILFSYLVFDRGIWTIYLLESNLNTYQIGIIESILHFTIVVFEIPTGIFVDILGKKRGLIIGRLLLILYVLFLLLYRNIYGITIAFILLGISETFMSGTSTAILYDNITEEEKNNDSFTLKMNSRTSLVVSLGLAFALITGGWLKKVSWNMVYIGIIITQVIAIFTISLIDKQKKGARKRDTKATKTKIRDLISDFFLIFKSKKIRNLTLGMMLFSGMLSTFYLFCPIELKSLGFSTSSISFIMGADAIISMYIYYKLEKVSEKINNSLVIKYTPLVTGALFFIGYLTWNKHIAVVIFLLVCNVGIIIAPITSTLINKELSSNSRATVLSAISFLQSVVTMLLFPLTGMLYQYIFFNKILIVYVVTVVASSLFFSIYTKLYNREEVNNVS